MCLFLKRNPCFEVHIAGNCRKWQQGFRAQEFLRFSAFAAVFCEETATPEPFDVQSQSKLFRFSACNQKGPTRNILESARDTIRSPECTAVAAIRLRMQMRILMRPENSLANCGHQISHKKLRIERCQGSRQRMRMVLRMKLRKFRPFCRNSLRMEICDKIR